MAILDNPGRPLLTVILDEVILDPHCYGRRNPEFPLFPNPGPNPVDPGHPDPLMESDGILDWNPGHPLLCALSYVPFRQACIINN